MNKTYPRLLVVVNNSFSLSNSNGRTLGSLLAGWPKDRIAQFCISSNGADFNVCENYYCVTDADVMHSCLRFKAAKRRDLKDAAMVNANRPDGKVVKHRKTSANMIVRNLAWMSGIWQGKEFKKWVTNFAPDVVMLQNGESFFMHVLAMQLARRTGAKLAVFNTEAYYLFKKDFFVSDGFFGRRLFKIYIKVYKHYFRCFMRQCKLEIYGNELLRKDYDEVFGMRNSHVIYTSSLLDFCPKPLSSKPIFLYAGNFGFDRPSALSEFAKVLGKINPDYKLDVYGFVHSKEMEQRLKACKDIRFHGAVSYDKVVEEMQKADFLIHAETNDPKWHETLRYGFSTKIADSVSSGRILILFAPEHLACSQYIKQTRAGAFAGSPAELENVISELLYSEAKRNEILSHAAVARKQNHLSEKNCEMMRDYLSEI